MNKATLLSIFLSLGMLACQSEQQTALEAPVIDVRTAMQKDLPISLKSDVERIEYIPLQTDDSYLISNLLNLQVSKDFLFMYNGKTSQILQFDKQGKFIRQIASEGNGPGEYGLISELAIDDKCKELSIFHQAGDVLVYSFDGEYLRSDTTMRQAGSMYVLSDGKVALEGLIMTPFHQAPWTGALKATNGGLESTKSLYPNSIKEDVRFMKDICFAPSAEGVLLFTACNDTVFRISSAGIKPACILKRDNAANYYEGVSDITKLRDNSFENDETIGVYDLFESPRHIYIRLYKGDGIYLQQFNKETRELKSHRAPADYLECSEAVPGNNVLGLDNDIDGGVPFWPEYACSDNKRAQVVSSYILFSMREKGYLKDAPAALNIGEDSNPVVILYTFKK
jgi:hypothetical protein